MTAHIEMPALDPTPNTPTTLSEPIVTGAAAQGAGVRRPDLHRLDGDGGRHGDATRPAKRPSAPSLAGNDVVLHSPDDGAAFAGDARAR